MLELLLLEDIREDDSVMAIKRQFRLNIKDEEGGENEGSSIPSKTSLPSDLEAKHRSFDVGGGGGKHAELPLELIRNYIQPEDLELYNSQVKYMIYCLVYYTTFK